MNRISPRHLSAARAVFSHTERPLISSSPWSSLSLARTLATSPSIPAPPATPAPPTTHGFESESIRDAVVSNVLHNSQPFQPETDASPITPDVIDASTMAEATSTELQVEGVPSIFSKMVGNAISSNPDTAAEVVEKASWSDTLLTPAMTVLNGVHDFSGLPWWASIGIATVSIRIALLPFTVMTMKNSALMHALKDDIAHYREGVMEAARAGDRIAANQRQTDMQSFMAKAGVAPSRVLLGPLVQFPVFISLFMSIRRLAANDPTLTTGGAAWFHDLSVMDPTYVLPIVCGVSLLTMTEFGGDSGQTKMSPAMKMGMRGVAVLSVPMTSWFPAAVFCYWIPNNMISVSLGMAMRRTFLKKRFGLLINPANIPGTRAARQLSVKTSSQSSTVSQGAAAASYAKKKYVSMPSAKTVKPVLLKVRPSKKKKSTKAQ